jgi:hypothetical protein
MYAMIALTTLAIIAQVFPKITPNLVMTAQFCALFIVIRLKS